MTVVEIDNISPDLTRLRGPMGISVHGAFVVADALWLTVNAYTNDDQYKTTYVALSRDREPMLIVEDQGVLPVVFAGPDDEAWAVVTNPYGDKDREVVRRIGGPIGPPMPPFVGTPGWLDGGTIVLVNINAFNTMKPDRWLRYDLATHKRKLIKLPLPGRAAYLPGDGGVHSFAHGGLHRLLAPTGEVLRERRIDLANVNTSAVELRFDGVSTLFATDGETLWWVTIAADGAVRRTQLASGSFYNLWPATRIGGAVALRHNGEHGNGWIVVRDGRVDSAVRSTPTGYVDAHDTRVIELPAATWILSALDAVGDELVAVIYGQDPSNRATELYVARIRSGFRRTRDDRASTLPQ